MNAETDNAARLKEALKEYNIRATPWEESSADTQSADLWVPPYQPPPGTVWDAVGALLFAAFVVTWIVGRIKFKGGKIFCGGKP